MTAESEIESLKHRLEEEEGNRRLIDEHISQYVTEPPLQLVKNRRQCEQKIKELQAQLARVKTGIRLDLSKCLSLVEIDLEKSAQILLKKVSATWVQANLDEVRRLCHAARSRADKTHDWTGVGLVHFYLAAVEARSNNLNKGIDFARRAIKVLRLARDHHNEMVAHLLLACIEQESQNWYGAEVECEEGLALCRKLESEGDVLGRRKQAPYEQIAVWIRGAKEYIVRAVAEEFLCSIPILQLSEGPDTITSVHPNRARYASTGEFVIAEWTYHPHPFLALEARDVHFILAVPKGSWPDLDLPMSEDRQLNPDDRGEEYFLMRKETQVMQEGPGALWTGENWASCRFERDPAGRIWPVPQPPKVIGIASIIALLKP
jgi:hypothetical protein